MAGINYAKPLAERLRARCESVRYATNQQLVDLLTEAANALDDLKAQTEAPVQHNARLRYRRPLGECAFCDEHRNSLTMPPHTASEWCESGKRPHCTCDACY